jgi:hypothetical protein
MVSKSEFAKRLGRAWALLHHEMLTLTEDQKHVVKRGEPDRQWTVDLELGTCTCPDFASNSFMADAEARGLKVAAYPGQHCKHELGALLLTGKLSLPQELGKLSPEERLLAHDAAKLECEHIADWLRERSRLARSTEPTRLVPILEVKARRIEGKQYAFPVGKRMVTSYRFAIGDLEEDTVSGICQERFGDVCNISKVFVPMQYAQGLMPLNAK